MIEYKTRLENDVAIWACFTVGDLYHEVNILGLEPDNIQLKLQEAQDDVGLGE